MSNNFRKYPKTKARFLYNFKDIQGLEFLFSNSGTLKFCTNPAKYENTEANGESKEQ
jgi:hypothetical protein